jgi:hypothetical protein
MCFFLLLLLFVFKITISQASFPYQIEYVDITMTGWRNFVINMVASAIKTS